MTDRKHPVSAAGTARAISRILRQDDFPKADTKRLRQSEGYYVYVVSNTVAVDYYIPGLYDNEGQDKRIRRQGQIARMRETLFELGYVSTHPREICIKCQQS